MKIIVVGAGFGGMAAAGLLARKGYDVRIYAHSGLTSEIHVKVIAEA